MALAITGLIYSSDLEQKNKETIFLSQQSAQKYYEFEEAFNVKDFLVIKREGKDAALIKELKGLCSDHQVGDFKNDFNDEPDCHFVTADQIPQNFQTLFKLKEQTEDQNYEGVILVSKDNEKTKEIINELKSNSKWGKIGRDLHITGVPFTNSMLDVYSKTIKEQLFPLLFTSIFILLCFIFRSLKSGVILFIPCLFGSALSLTVTKLLFHESNLITSIIPLLIFVINLSLGLHLFYTTIEKKDFSLALKEKLKPSLLMVLTTFVGFLSLGISELQAIKQFGMMSAFLIVFSSLATIVWFYLVNRAVKIEGSYHHPKISHFLQTIFNKFFGKPLILAVSLLAIILGSIVLPQIQILTDATDYFPKSSQIKESIINVSKSVSGMPTLEVILDFPEEITMDHLNKIQVLEKKLQESFKIISSNVFVELGNEIYSGSKSLPQVLLPYHVIRSKIPTEIMDGYPIENQYRITLLSSPMNVDEYEKVIQKVEENLKGWSYHFNGLYYHLMVAQKEMITTLFKSFLLSLIIISFIAFITFKKVKIFFIFLFVNTIPVFISFVFLKLFNLSFNIATVMTYSISLGLIVDSSFHIIHMLDSDNLQQDYFFKTVSMPIITSSAILCLCFLMFTFSDFLPIKEFGECLSIIIFLGLIFDLKILPSIYLNRKEI
tara:strand:- start:119471 stop:121459 length:1989 start_codon:yes stop_codon:yes gene_type:complete